MDGVGFEDESAGGSLGGGILGEVVEMKRTKAFGELVDGDRRCNGMALGLTTLANDLYISAGGFLAAMVGCKRLESCGNG